jgi:hypothetical protein
MAEPVVVGVVAAPSVPRALAEQLARELPAVLSKEFPDVEWRVELADGPRAARSADARELIEEVWRRMLEHDWDLAIGITDLPLRAGRRPVTAHASATHGVGLVSLPALGAVGRERRLRAAVLHLIEGLLGETIGISADPANAARMRRMSGRLQELRSPLGRQRVHADGTIRFVGAVLRGNLRLLVGMVRANEPSTVIVRLSGALVAALGVAALSVILSDAWRLADAMTWVRLLVFSIFSIAVTSITVIAAHDLWERTQTPLARERVIIFNLATAATIVLGVLTLYVALFVITALCAGGLIPSRLLEEQVHHPVGFGDYVQLGWFVASLATLGGALGSVTDSDLEVRDAIYRHRADERTEAGPHA